MKYLTFALSLCILASGCASSGNPNTAEPEEKSDGFVSSGMKAGGQVVQETRDGFGDAALAPLEDLNLKRKQIPDVIKSYVSPYDPVQDMDCPALSAEIEGLNSVLAKDFDEQIQEKIKKQDNKDNGAMASKASDFALDTIASEARGFIPFRGLVRQASGANAHKRKVDQAFQKAYLRRAYLKGIGHGKGCTFPAAPIPYELKDLEPASAPIQYRTAPPDNEQE